MRNPGNSPSAHDRTPKPTNDNGSAVDVAVNLALHDLVGLLADAYVATLTAEANDNRAVASGGSVR